MRIFDPHTAEEAPPWLKRICFARDLGPSGPARPKVARRHVVCVSATQSGNEAGGPSFDEAQPDHAVPPVLAGATVGKNIASHLGKFDGVIKLPIGKQTRF